MNLLVALAIAAAAALLMVAVRRRLRDSVLSEPARGTPMLTMVESAAVRYELACFEATAGHRDAALERLQEAIERAPAVVAYARDDEDFASLHADREFTELVKPS